MSLVRAIVTHDNATASELIARTPALATAREEKGATRQEAKEHYLVEINHYLYGGDTALHIAAAAYESSIVRQLVSAGADIAATNRRGAQPLHYAGDGSPGSNHWNPKAQAETVASLIEAGADPNATDKSGVAPLHRAVRTRCAAAVRALLEGGADPGLTNGKGSTPLQLAKLTTGRGGSGSEEARAQQEVIIQLLSPQ
jgi:ankyrin repeat protein